MCIRASGKPALQQRLIRQLKDCGILGRRERGERKRERNDRICDRHAQGSTPGQIGFDESMSRDAVRQVLRRRKKRGTLKNVPIAG